MSTLHLVRHAAPDASPDVAPGSWPLTADGRAAAAALARRLPADAVVVASPALRALQTVAPLAAPEPDERLAEVRRDEAWAADARAVRALRATRRAYVEGAVVPGWEPQAEVARRLDDAVVAWLGRTERDVVVAGHGMAITVWLTARGLLDPGRAGRFWDDLTLPDCWVVPRSLDALDRLAPS